MPASQPTQPASQAASPAASQPADAFQWLEEIEGAKQLAWVKAQNERTLAALQGHKMYAELFQDALKILTSDARIPIVGVNGATVDNFWQDDTHVRGIWRRASRLSYTRGRPRWRTVLDVDALAKKEGENWVYKFSSCLPPAYDRCMVGLSRGGTDAYVGREFSAKKKVFVADGFVMPEGKNASAWLDANHLLVSSDWGDGLTVSGYPREVRVWKRGTPFDQAERLFLGEKNDVAAEPMVFRHGTRVVAAVRRSPSFFEHEMYVGRTADALKKLDVPARSRVIGLFRSDLVFRLDEAWTARELPAGALVGYNLDTGKVSLIFAPTDRQAIASVAITKSSIVISMMEDVIGRAKRFRLRRGRWTAKDIKLPSNGVIALAGASGSIDDLFVLYESLTQPQTLYAVSGRNRVRKIQSLPAFFDAKDVRVEQRFATSRDGTKVPYFVMGRADVLAGGPAPTLQYGYGGFLIPIRPVYYREPSRPQHGALAGKMWVQRGGVLVLSNIRGGAEYGPRWHAAALKENRQRAFDDFFAISEDLIARNVTTAKMLGAIGRSNGGLLMGVALTQRPDLYAAIDCGVPLFDMKRYNQLLAGASWMGEYGNPDKPDQWTYIQKYSPYQKLEKGRPYPQVFFYTSTKDDRVHPGHARKAVAKLNALGYPTYYYENIEGGHGGTANQEQLAMRTALEYTYFFEKLMPPQSRGSPILQNGESADD